MADYDVDDTVLQRVLDPLFSFLSSVLPPPIYGIVEPLITHSVSLLAALVKFALTLVHADSWDAQKILPPLITLLAAYLALVSFYRTTGWMIRTAFWFVKWGGILSALAAGAGYFMGNAANGENGVAGAFQGGGLLSMLGSALLGMLNQDEQNGAGRGSRSTRNTKSRAGASSPRTRAQTKKQEKTRPKSWDTWDKHEKWQYDAKAAARDDAARANDGVQETVQKVMGVVNEALGTGWWETVKNAVEGSGLVGSGREGSKEDDRSPRRSKRDSKAKGNTR